MLAGRLKQLVVVYSYSITRTRPGTHGMAFISTGIAA